MAHGEMRRRAAQQRTRRMARRHCGNCHEPAEVMLDWGAQRIPICRLCHALLTGSLPDWPALEWRQGIRCPTDAARPCYECIQEDPAPAEDSHRRRGRIFEFLFQSPR